MTRPQMLPLFYSEEFNRFHPLRSRSIQRGQWVCGSEIGMYLRHAWHCLVERMAR